eukprot:2663972-Prymnesium_polylepis.1
MCLCIDAQGELASIVARKQHRASCTTPCDAAEAERLEAGIRKTLRIKQRRVASALAFERHPDGIEEDLKRPNGVLELMPRQHHARDERRGSHHSEVRFPVGEQALLTEPAALLDQKLSILVLIIRIGAEQRAVHHDVQLLGGSTKGGDLVALVEIDLRHPRVKRPQLISG